MNIRKLANGYLVVGVIIAALWPVMLSLAKNVNVYEFLFLENVIAVAAALLLIVITRKLTALRGIIKDKRNLGIIILVAMLSYVTPDFGMLYAEHFISASLASIIFRTYPILMLIFLPLILNERITKFQILALVLGFAGLFIAIYPTAGITLSGNALIGVALTLVVALATAASFAIIKRYIHETESALFIYNLTGFVVYSVLFIANGMPMQTISSPGWAAILYTAVIYSVASAYGLYYVLKLVKTTYLTNLFYFAPFLTFIFADLILGKSISLYYVVSAGLIAFGVLMQKFDKVGGSYASSSKTLSVVQIFDMTSSFVNSKEKDMADLIRNNGRVLATKIGRSHESAINEISKMSIAPKLMTNLEYRFANEMEIISELLGKKENELILLAAGEETECEKALESVFKRLNG